MLSGTYFESIQGLLPILSSAVLGSEAHLPAGIGSVLAVCRYVQGLKYGLLAGIFNHLFYSKFASYCFQVTCIPAYNASFGNGAGKLFLGLAAFAVGRILTGLDRRLRFS